MPVFKTKTNRVVADDPELDDTHVQVVWLGPTQDGKHYQQFLGPLLPVEDYDEAIEWARAMADQMVYPLYVCPMTGAEALRTEQMQRAMANLSDQERGEYRQYVAATLARIMRHSDEPSVRAEAHDILVQMKVVKP